MFLGSSQKGSVDITGVLAEVGRLKQTKLEWMVKIQSTNTSKPFVLGAVSREQAVEWRNLIVETAHIASTRVIEQI